MPPTRDTPKNKRTIETESEVLKENIPSKWTGKKSRVEILTSDKIIKRDTKGHFIILKNRIYEEDINSVNICTQHRSTQIYKEYLGGLKERYRQQHTYSRGF